MKLSTNSLFALCAAGSALAGPVKNHGKHARLHQHVHRRFDNLTAPAAPKVYGSQGITIESTVTVQPIEQSSTASSALVSYSTADGTVHAMSPSVNAITRTETSTATYTLGSGPTASETTNQYEVVITDYVTQYITVIVTAGSPAPTASGSDSSVSANNHAAPSASSDAAPAYTPAAYSPAVSAPAAYTSAASSDAEDSSADSSATSDAPEAQITSYAQETTMSIMPSAVYTNGNGTANYTAPHLGNLAASKSKKTKTKTKKADKKVSSKWSPYFSSFTASATTSTTTLDSTTTTSQTSMTTKTQSSSSSASSSSSLSQYSSAVSSSSVKSSSASSSSVSSSSASSSSVKASSSSSSSVKPSTTSSSSVSSSSASSSSVKASSSSSSSVKPSTTSSSSVAPSTTSSSSVAASTTSSSSAQSSASSSSSSTSAGAVTAPAPAPTGTGTVSGCTEWYVAQSGDYCSLIATEFNLNVNTFMSWNPSVNAPSCNSLYAGYAYCVATTGTPVVSSSAAGSTTPASLPAGSSTTSSAPASTATGSYAYQMYSGNGTVAAGWPAMSQWLDFDDMWNFNVPIMQQSCSQWGVPNNSPDEIADIKSSVQSISASSGVDARFILAIIMQESNGCVRVITTNYGVENPGLMQDHDGAGSCNRDGVVQTPCPASEITQMITDGTTGTASGDGLVQCIAETNLSDVSMYYAGARIYNGGIGGYVPDNLGSGCCTLCYSSDVANRLTGWHSGPSGCTL